MSTMLQETRQGGTVVLTLDYPARRNALAMPMRAALAEAFDRLDGDCQVRAIVLTGAAGNFSAGGDISGMDAADVAAGRERFRLTHRLVRGMIESSKPIVAAVEGWAAGAGLALALCCDTIVAADDAQFIAGFGRVGLVGDFGLLHTLPRRVGEGRARQMLLHGEAIGAMRAEAIGLVDRIVPAGAAVETALDLASSLTRAAPLPIAMTKSYLARGLADALEWERNVQSMLFLTADHAEGKAAFLAKRAPVFTGR